MFYKISRRERCSISIWAKISFASLLPFYLLSTSLLFELETNLGSLNYHGERGNGAKLTVFQRSGTENGRHSIRSPQKPWKRKNYDSTGRDRGSGDRRLLPLVGSRDFTIFWETLLHGRAPLLFPLHFSPIFHALSYFEIDFEIIKISREHGLTSGETRVTRLEFRVLVVESRREVGNKFTGTIEQTAAKLVLPAVKISLDKISKILRLWKFFVKLGKRFEKYSRVK